MRRVVLAALIIAGLASWDRALGDQNFDHEHPGGIPSEEVVVPGADGQNIDELADEYARALRQVQTTAAPTPTIAPQTITAAEQVKELPWPVLESALDGDGDGLSGADELRLQTSAQRADSDGDGFIDGLEVVRGYNPLVRSPGDKIDFSLSGLTEAQRSEELRVMDIRIEESGDQPVLVFTGLGPPNAVITLFVFSETPRVVFVRTDVSGRFRIILENTLEQGEHRAYLAVTDAAGKAQQVGGAKTFKRTAEAITLVDLTASPASSALPSVSRVVSTWPWWALEAVGMMIVLALVGVAIALRRRRSIPPGTTVGAPDSRL